MRASIVAWSALSGAILGLFIDATFIGVALLLLGGLPERGLPKWAVAAGVAVMAVVLVAMTLLGYLEGLLKAS